MRSREAVESRQRIITILATFATDKALTPTEYFRSDTVFTTPKHPVQASVMQAHATRAGFRVSRQTGRIRSMTLIVQ